MTQRDARVLAARRRPRGAPHDATARDNAAPDHSGAALRFVSPIATTRKAKALRVLATRTPRRCQAPDDGPQRREYSRFRCSYNHNYMIETDGKASHAATFTSEKRVVSNVKSRFSRRSLKSCVNNRRASTIMCRRYAERRELSYSASTRSFCV